MITRSLLRQVLEYDAETGTFRWKAPSRWAGLNAGSLVKKGYMIVSICGTKYYLHRLAWLYVYGSMPEAHIDHINSNKSDNRIANLRVASNAQNLQNRGPNINNRSGHKGVYWFSARGKWKAEIMAYGRRHFLGHFLSADEAAAAYRAAASRLHGEFAKSERSTDGARLV